MSMFKRKNDCSICHQHLYYNEETEMLSCGCGVSKWVKIRFIINGIMKPNMRVCSDWVRVNNVNEC